MICLVRYDYAWQSTRYHKYSIEYGYKLSIRV